MNLEKETKKIAGLKDLLAEASKGMNREEAEKTVKALLGEFKEFDTIPDMKFYAFFDPRHVPSDARVDFVYTPTYLACAVTICAINEHEDLLSDEEIRETLYYGLNGCTGRRFLGHGFDDTAGFLDAMDIFAQCDVLSFVERHPDLSPKFTEAIDDAVKYLEEGLCSGRVKDPWSGKTFTEKAVPILEHLKKKNEETVNVFVYGTLMKGQRAAHMLGDCIYKGRHVLKDHALYDLGDYPGIVGQKGESIIGELYAIEKSRVAELDRYEGEGQLYIRKKVTVSNGAENTEAFAYIYNQSLYDSPMMRTVWGISGDDEVWYACYGSNLSKERFRCYIKGGKCKQNGVTYKGCSDKSKWTDEAVMTFGGELYFGNESSSWGGKGVAFYDPDAEGETHMKLYRIKYSQFLDIRQQEGQSPNWYGRIVCLGIRNDIPVYTLTSEKRRPANAPCRGYISLIANAMKKELRLRDRTIIDTLISIFED